MKWRIFRKADVFWWLLAGALGEGSFLLGLRLPLQNALVGGLIGLFIAGAAMGWLKPVGVWRWGIGSVLFFPVVEFIGVVMDRPVSFSLLDSVAYVVIKVPVYGLQALPAMLGAYLTVFAKRGVPRVVEFRLLAKAIRLWVLGFAIGLAIGGIYIGLGNILSFWHGVTGFFLIGIVLGVIHNAAWRWGISIALGHVTGITFRIITDSLLGRSSHNLFPIEMFFAALVAGPPVVAGAYTGAVLGWVFGVSSGNGKLAKQKDN